jgi:hypothetical protein
VNGHLVTVEVSVECCTNEWVNLKGFTFNQDWLERLNSETVQCWSTVQHDWVLFDDVFKNVPHLWAATLDHALCALNVLSQFKIDEALHNEWLEQFKTHQFWNSALVQTQCRTSNDY